MLKRPISIVLIILHLVTFGPIKDAVAFSAQSAGYNLTTGALNEGGSQRSANTLKLLQDTLGEPCAGNAQSASYILSAGFIPTIQSNPPILTQQIPYQTWPINSSKDNAFDLDSYFLSPEGYPLTFTVSGSLNITIAIDPNTHIVNFSQNPDWYGVEKVYFYAQDSENSTTQSNKVVLQVENIAGQDKPVIIESQLTPLIIKEGDLVKSTVKAIDLDNEAISFTYSDFFTQTRTWQEQGFWYSEATWQTASNTKGHYTIRVTVTGASGLTDTEEVLVNVGNFNSPPVLNTIPDVTANEGDLVIITPQAQDSDKDSISFYYSAPFDSEGKWLTGYDDAGVYTVQVIASDGIDTVSQDAKVIINSTNRAPQVILTLSKYTVTPNEEITINLSGSDPDGDSMSFLLKKDGTEIASGALTPLNTYTLNTSFANIGDHTVSATVTDSQGLSSTATAGLDVADPNANRDSINPVMGDFNGDALSDLGLHNSDTGIWEIALSDKGIFRNAIDWLTGFGTSKDFWPLGGDFNGDGKTDAAVYNNTAGELKVALSSGSNFSSSGTWLTFPGASYSWQPFTGNFNADRYTDFALYNKDTGEVKVALGSGLWAQGSGFGAFVSWLSSSTSDIDSIAFSGDFNADSLTDLCLFKKSSGEFKIAFSNSQAFIDGATRLSGFATEKDPIISDFNNDGLADIGYWDKTSASWYYAQSTGISFVDKGLWQAPFGASTDESASTGDFDGNGITDRATFDRDQLGINRWTTQLLTDKPTDLLTEIDNGIGGKTNVTYTYAASFDNPELPFPVYIASSISLVNSFPVERTSTYTHDFTFSGGYYDAVEREFRGFAKVKVTDPITGNFTETYFYQGRSGQDGALKGQIEKIIAYDGNARKISETLNTYEVRKAGPQERVLGFPFIKENTTTIWEENATYITTKDKYTYDNIGNLLEELQEGDSAKTGDDKSTFTTYAQAYEVGFNRPLETLLKDKDGNTVSKKNFEYDNKGNLIKDIILIFNPLTGEQANPQTQYSYDSFGNLTSNTDALGRTTTTDYETVFYAYPQKVTNVLGHTIQYGYDPKFGVVTRITDPNGLITDLIYDSLGRLTQKRISSALVTYQYLDFNTKLTTNALGLVTTEYIDSLGRKYKTILPGEDGISARQVISEVFYNNRGLLEKESLAHYLDEDLNQISYVRYEYDIRGRIKKTISDFPGEGLDAESSINYISPLYTEATDPQGHRKGALNDVWGNIIEVTEFTSDGVFKTAYEYDIQNNLTKTIDSQGNTTQIFYDSLGRKLKMQDPDMGTWTYEYDLVGNLTKQTDAKGQVLEFEYDGLNRLTRKLANMQTLVAYIYDDTTKPNCIGRLSKVTDLSGSTEFFYDELGREVKSIKTVGSMQYAVSREYDVLDRLTKLTYPDGEIVNYGYDPNSGFLERVYSINSQQSTVNYTSDILYNSQGQIRTISYGNDTTTNYTYAQDLRLSRILTTHNSQLITLQDLNYIFDKNGSITTLTDNLRSNIRTFIYDDLDRLTQASNVPSGTGGYTNYYYQYDSIGNMTYKSDVGVMTYALNAGPHALTSAGGYSYQYDANGNMIQGKNKTLEYDVENRLIRVTEPIQTTTFTYDGDGGRVKKNSTNSITQQTQETLYIGSLYEIETSNQSTVTRKHIFAGSNRVCSITQDAQLNTQYAYYHPDHLGSSSIITDENGTQIAYYEYTPYGTLARNELANPQTGSPVNHYFTGKELDQTGLYFYGARYYDPEIGRFITADTIVQSPYDPQTFNRYSYCGNNPINYIDPGGHWFFAAIVAIIKAVAAYAAAHPVIFGAAVGAVSNTAFNASNIHNFSNFITFAGIGAVSGGVFGGVASGVGGVVGKTFGSFWGNLAGAAAGGLAGGFTGAFGNSLYAGASFGEALAFGVQVGSIMAAISTATAGAAYGTAKVVSAIKQANAQTSAAGVKTPLGQQGKGSATSSLNIDKGKTASVSQALSSRGTEDSIDLGRIVVKKGVEPAGYRYVGPGEVAEAANTGYVPNTTIAGDPKPVFYTPEDPLTSASQAQKAYNLESLPTHRIGLDTSKTTNIYGGNVEGGTAIEMITNEKIPVVDIQKLGN